MNVKKTFFTRLMALSLMVLVVSNVVLLPTKAAEGDSGSGFSVQAIYPENQRETASYFDLRVKPKDTQDLQVQIQNNNNETIIIDVFANPGFTNGFGNIEYKKSEGTLDESLVYNFADLITIKEPQITLGPKESKTVTFHLEIPEKPFDGMVLGGLTFTRVPEDEGQEGVSITNVYSYVIGVVLTENDKEIPPDFDLINVKPELFNYHSALIHSIRNPMPILADNVKLDIKVFEADSQNPLLEENADIRFAPNSIMDYIIYVDDIGVSPGKYVSKVHMECEGKEWDFEFPFEIKGEEAAKMNEETVQKPTKASVPYTLIIVIGILIIIILLLVIILLKSRKKKS